MAHYLGYYADDREAIIRDDDAVVELRGPGASVIIPERNMCQSKTTAGTLSSSNEHVNKTTATRQKDINFPTESPMDNTDDSNVFRRDLPVAKVVRVQSNFDDRTFRHCPPHKAAYVPVQSERHGMISTTALKRKRKRNSQKRSLLKKFRRVTGRDNVPVKL